MKKSCSVILLFLLLCIRAAWAQNVVVHLSSGQKVFYDVALVDSISFDEMTADGHRYVDLGLPSGTLWATCNVGAASPEDCGLYFAWAETEPKDAYAWDSYRYRDDAVATHLAMTKYCIDASDGSFDGKFLLDPEDDAAAAAWGSEWQMPTPRQLSELTDRQYTRCGWTTLNDVNGLLVTSLTNGCSIFLPAAGLRQDSPNGSTDENIFGDCLKYWSRSLYDLDSKQAYNLTCFEQGNGPYVGIENRAYGLTVRPVRYREPVSVSSIGLNEESLSMQLGDMQYLSATVEPEYADNPFVLWESSNEDVATVDRAGGVTAVGPGTCTVTCRATDGSGVYAECQVTVVSHITSIELNESPVYMVVDGTLTLTPVVEPAGCDVSSLIWTSSDESIAMVNGNGTVSAINPGSCYITCRATDGDAEATCQVIVQNYLGFVNGYKWVNLGLPSGTLWATCNVGVDSPDNYEESGNKYAWGETEPKDSYSWSTYKYCNGTSSTMTKYCQAESAGFEGYTDNLVELQPEDDAATVNWGSGWETPSREQFEEIFDPNYTTFYWTEERGVKVRSISSGMSIFLPAAGHSGGFSGQNGYYWTRTLESGSVNAYIYTSSSTYPYGFGIYLRYFGLRVRPVVKK